MLHRMIPSALIFLCAFVQCSEKQPVPKYTGDLPQLQDRGVLRVIVSEEPITYIPRQAEPVTLDYDIAHSLADALNLKLELVKADNYVQMLEKLLGGEGDIIASSLTITPDREKIAAFSVPYLYVDEYLITARADSLPQTVADLAGMEISVWRSSSYYQTLIDVQKEVPSLRIRTVSDTLGTEGLIKGIAQGEYKATLCDAHLWHAIANYHDNLVAPLVVAEDRPLALMMRPNDTKLKVVVDEYLLAHQFTRHRQQEFTDDLPGLKDRRRLRMITRNNAMTYFIYRGQQVGFEYELMKRFASEHGLRLEIVIPDSHAEMLPYLNEGKGDVVASAMTITEERQEQAAFTLPYNEVSELVVVHADDDSIANLQDLAGRTIHVRASSSFYTTLMALRDSVKGLEIAIVPDDVETEDILAGVEEGIYDLTMCDSHLFDIERAYGRRLKAALSIKPTALGWAVRKDNSELLAALNKYIKEEKGGLFFNMMRNRYFKSTRAVARAKDSMRVGLSGQLSPYDDLTKKYASQYGQDWR
ncbi:MAG: transporter substrate-binding domain-containing protein, partial [Gemmatimonadota bacterium]|nr:transporter substrate-binding domain-containing protein [Gemmatimonadota bacterium]